ncbi:creatininase family protein [soil metagenome]
MRKLPLALIALPLLGSVGKAQTTSKRTGIRLADLTWVEAERVLDTSTVIVIPLGAESKEHGPQLRLKNDLLLATYFTDRVLRSSNVVVAPVINYSFYPAFVEYAGSTTLRLETARDMIVDICRSLARHGPRRFYILNTGVSTVRALKPAQDSLLASGIVMRFTNGGRLTDSVEKAVSKQAGGTHADEIETSMLLYMYPQFVDMNKAANDYHPGPGALTRDSAVAVREGKAWSRTGIYGNATLATREKGRRVVEAHVLDILAEIEALRKTPIGDP